MRIKLFASFLPVKISIETPGGAVLPKLIWSAPKDPAWISTSWTPQCTSFSESVQKRSYRECAAEKSPLISSECVGLRETYFNCKRGQVDMRARIRGNKGY